MRNQNSLATRARLPYGEFLKNIFVTFTGFLFFVSPSLSVLASPPQNPQERGPANAQTAAQGNVEIATLEPGQPIERELGGGEYHTYRIALVAGQYARIMVEQRGIEVALTLFGPDDKALSEVDNQDGMQGPEVISLVAATSGRHRLEVRSPEKQAPAGRYEVKIEELRAATPQDESRVAAQRALTEARRLVSQQAAESLRKAVEKYREALALWRAVGDQRGEADTLTGLGGVHIKLDEKQNAIESLEQALKLWRAMGDHSGEARTFDEIGILHQDVGEYQKALDVHQQALVLRRAAGDRKMEARALNNIAMVYLDMGEYQKALEFHQQVLPIRKALGDVAGESNTLNNIGGAYNELGEHQKALDYFNQSLTLRRSIGDRRGQAFALNNLASIHFRTGDYPKVLEYFDQVLGIFRETGDRRSEAIVLNNIGMVRGTMKDHPKAIEYLEQALAILRELGDQPSEATTLYTLAYNERDRGNPVEARALVDAAIRIVESLRGKIASPSMRASYLASILKYYKFNADLLVRMHRERPSAGFDAAALQVSERARARSLLEMLSEARVDVRQGVDPKLLERERSLRQSLDAKAEQQSRPRDKSRPAPSPAVAAEISALASELEVVQAQIRQKSPRYAALVQPVPLSLKEIQQLLDPETLLLEYSLGTQRSYLWAVTQTSLDVYDLPKGAEIEKQAQHVYELLTARNQRKQGETDEQRRARVVQAEAEYPKAAGALSQILLGPVAAQLGKKRLVVVGDGALQYVPFASLPEPATGGQPLAAEHELVSLPSASVLGVLRQESQGRKPAPKAVAVIADPVFDGEDVRVRGTAKVIKARGAGALAQDATATAVTKTDPASTREVDRAAGEAGLAGDSAGRIRRLPFSRHEAEMILASVPAGSGMKAVDFKATRETATSAELGQYRIVHFATHGLLNGEHPELSGIILSLVDQNGRDRDGFLRLHEVYNLRLSADLVVLSACQTALGKQVRGEGLVGLVRGFMYAGAKGVVASLWKVDDEATAELMKIFYRGMLKDGMRPAAALQAAKVEMSRHKRWHSPYYWAAFELQGEWR
jgi:CHAT domain-containing protein/tetratricopeptide (TPR) repeat protein